MKLNENFILNKLADNWVLVPYGQHAVDFQGVVTLNETAKFLFENAINSIEIDELKRALVNEYSISDDVAENAVKHWILEMREAGCIVD